MFREQRCGEGDDVRLGGLRNAWDGSSINVAKRKPIDVPACSSQSVEGATLRFRGQPHRDMDIYLQT